MRFEPYQPADKQAWDAFVSQAKNATFLFYRDYMDYHAHRFTDASLLMYEDGELVALFPASIMGETVSSHGGLTYGGVLTGSRMTAKRMLEIMSGLKAHYARRGVRSLRYKAVPSIYASLPADEDLYALFIHEATLVRRDISSAIALQNRLPFAKGKKYNLSKAKKAGLAIRQTQDYEAFWAIEIEALKAHGATPVHSLEEISRLAARFPDHIRLYGAFRGEEMLAGTVVYAHGLTAHTQYMGANAEGFACGALDAIIAALLDGDYQGYRYFDFGISTEDGGRTLNEGLIAQKEMFGGRAVLYDHYEMSIA
jgi:hypothetical protein